MQRVLRPVPVGTDTPAPSVAPPAQSLGMVMSPAPGEYCEAEERTDGHILTSWIVTPALVFNRSMYPLMAGPNICMVELSQAPLAGRIWAEERTAGHILTFGIVTPVLFLNGSISPLKTKAGFTIQDVNM